MSRPDRVYVTEVAPRTPSGRAVATVVGDSVTVTAQAVCDGHSLLSGHVRWRPVGGDWATAALAVGRDGDCRATFTPSAPGAHEFEVVVWVDEFATWRRDLPLRAAGGEELAPELEAGARLLDAVVTHVPAPDQERVADAAATLRSDCKESVKVAAGTDDALAQAVAGTVPVCATVEGPFPFRVDPELAVRGAWYEFFPRSEGGFVAGANSYERLDAVAAAGFDVVYLPPVHPIGTTKRKGRNNSLTAGPGDVGSPWAIGSPEGGHTALHPDLGTFEDFDRFVAHAASLGVQVAMDVALQCSPDHPWVTEHPEWFVHRTDGSIRTAENPPKRYEDIFPLNFWPDDAADRLAMWAACRDIFEFWAARGIRVFRVDNPHTKPLAFWEWALADLRTRHPDLVFLAEAFTAPPMMHLLGEIGFSQSYTYFTWRTGADELMAYGEELAHAPSAGWFRPNLWPNTPDILIGPLRDGSREVFESRAVLAATMAPSWGVYSGFELGENRPASPKNEEYADSEKYQLVERDHDDPDSLMPLLARLNRVRREHPALWRMQSFRAARVDHPSLVAYTHRSGDDVVLVVVNLDPSQVGEATVGLDLWSLGLPTDAPFTAADLLTGESWTWQGAENYVRLDPAERVAHVLALHRA